MRVFREPCYFAEAVYLLYFFVNQISYEEEYSRISRNYYKRVKEDDEDEARILRRVRELNRVLSVVTAGLDRGDARLRYYFKAMQLPSFKNSCCLAQIMLVTVPLDCSDVEEFAGRLEREYAHMQEIGFKINDLNAMGLVMDIWEEQEKREPLMVQLERLPCSAEERWSILRVLTEYEPHLRELTELIRPVAERLKKEMTALNAMNEAALDAWCRYFQTHTPDDFQNEMFNTTFPLLARSQHYDIWLGLWNFNHFGTWSYWLERPEAHHMVRFAYIGAAISFRFAVKKKKRPDSEGLGSMLRALGGKDKLEILRRCAQQPCSAAKLAAEMNVNSGTISKNLYGLFQLGYLETRSEGERVNYSTRFDTLEQIFQWVIEYVGGGR